MAIDPKNYCDTSAFVPARGASRHTRIATLATLAAIVCGFVSPADAVTPAELIDSKLGVQAINVTSLRDETLHYFDHQRTLRSSEIRTLVQLRSIGGVKPAESATGAMIWLTDGQRFTGLWVGPTPDGAHLRWRHPWLGLLSIPLEDVAQVSWFADADAVTGPPSDPPLADTMVLVNGDQLTGFVSALTEQGVSLIPSAGGEAVTISYHRIRLMRLANPARRVVDPYHRVTLADGSRAWADQIQLDDDYASWRSIPPGSPAGSVQVPIEQLASIDFRAGGFRLIDLTDLPRRTVREASVFGLTRPVRVEGRSIQMHAPAAVAFDLPDGAERFAAVAELDTTTDPAKGMSDWPDFHLVILTEGVEVARGHLSGQEPTVRINTPISGSTMTIRLDAGVNGPILDRLRLRDAVILAQVPGSTPSDSRDR